MSDAYAAAGVDTSQADLAVGALVGVLRRIELGRPSRSVVPSGHYASVLRVSDELGIAISTDGVGSKLVIAEQTGRLDTVGIDCIAMNVNDLVCVGAEPIAMVDYLAVEQADPDALAQIAEGLRIGAMDAGIEIPGGELAVIPELIRGHPSPGGFDLCGTAIGTVALDSLVLGDAIQPGDALDRRCRRAACTPTATRSPVACSIDDGPGLDARPPELLRPQRRRRAARADGDLRARGARPAALGAAGPRPRAHHRRRPDQPAPPGTGARRLQRRAGARPRRRCSI